MVADGKYDPVRREPHQQRKCKGKCRPPFRRIGIVNANREVTKSLRPDFPLDDPPGLVQFNPADAFCL